MKRLLIVCTVIAIGIIVGIHVYRTFENLMIGNAFANVQHTQPPLTTAEVEKLMGSPARIEHSETTGITGDVYHYPASSGSERKIVFVNGTVFSAEFLPGAKS